MTTGLKYHMHFYLAIAKEYISLTQSYREDNVLRVVEIMRWDGNVGCEVRRDSPSVVVAVFSIVVNIGNVRVVWVTRGVYEVTWAWGWRVTIWYISLFKTKLTLMFLYHIPDMDGILEYLKINIIYNVNSKLMYR